jgi:glycosyltransferase involved in cell wall biosynthesis
MGGFRVIYEYANRLADRGHEVTVIHPRRLAIPIPEDSTVYQRIRRSVRGLRELLVKPFIGWHKIDPRVRLLFVPSSAERYIPDGDAIFATSWHTVKPVADYLARKGNKFDLVQGYGTWQGPMEIVDETWRAPMQHIAVSKWLVGVGKELGCKDLTYIPNAIDHEHYRLTQAMEGRPRQVAMLFSIAPVKGSVDGIEALRITREKYPDLKVVFFGTSRPESWIPEWAEYYRNPPQAFIVNEIYNKSSIFLSPSLSEGFALPPAEAAACGCAIVASDSGGVRDFIEDGVTGCLSSPKDPSNLAKNVCLLLENDDLRLRLARAAKSFVDRMNWEHSTDLLENLMARVWEQKRQPLETVSSRRDQERTNADSCSIESKRPI